MNKLVYKYVPNEFVIGYVLLTLLIKRLAVAMVNKTVNHPPVYFSRIILAKFFITPYFVTVCVFPSVNKTDNLDLIFFRHVIAYNFTLVNGLFENRKWSKVHNHDQIVLFF
jgi:hypothetical protein